MIELIMSPEQVQLVRLGADQAARLRGDQAAYDRDLRPKLMVKTIRKLQGVGMEPGVWKVDGLDRREDCEKIVEKAQHSRRERLGCIIFGRGSDQQEVRSWLKIAVGVPGFIGFAIGRTTWWDAVVAWREKNITQQAAAAQIAERFREWVDIFEQAHRG